MGRILTLRDSPGHSRGRARLRVFIAPVRAAFKRVLAPPRWEKHVQAGATDVNRQSCQIRAIVGEFWGIAVYRPEVCPGQRDLQFPGRPTAPLAVWSSSIATPRSSGTDPVQVLCNTAARRCQTPQGFSLVRMAMRRIRDDLGPAQIWGSNPLSSTQVRATLGSPGVALFDLVQQQSTAARDHAPCRVPARQLGTRGAFSGRIMQLTDFARLRRTRCLGLAV